MTKQTTARMAGRIPQEHNEFIADLFALVGKMTEYLGHRSIGRSYQSRLGGHGPRVDIVQKRMRNGSWRTTWEVQGYSCSLNEVYASLRRADLREFENRAICAQQDAEWADDQARAALAKAGT